MDERGITLMIFLGRNTTYWLLNLYMARGCHLRGIIFFICLSLGKLSIRIPSTIVDLV